MKVLILYTSLGGTTKVAAERIASGFAASDVTAVNLKNDPIPDDSFDATVFLAPVYFGKLEKTARRFLKEQREKLLQTRLFLGFCCGLTDEAEEYAGSVFPKEIAEHAETLLYLGGSLRAKGRPFLHRLILWKMRSVITESEMEDGEYTPILPGFLPENADRIVASVKAAR